MERTAAAEAAIDECREVARAIVKLGRNGTATEVCEASGLDRETVVRRLRSSGVLVPPAFRYFLFDNVSRTWGLTDLGRKLAKGK